MPNPIQEPIIDVKNMDAKARSHWIKMIVTRMIIAWKAKDYKGLSEKIDLNEKAPANWVQRGTVPWTHIYSCHVETGKPLEWLLHGSVGTFNPSEKTNKALYKSADTLIKSSEQMEMMSFQSKEVRDSFIRGLTKGFLTTMNESEF